MAAAVSLLCIGLLASRVDAGQLLVALRDVRLWPLAIALATKALGFGCLALRTRVLLNRFGRWPFATFLRAHLVGFGGNVLLPFRLGELLRARHLARRCGLSLSACLGAAVVERILDLLWLALFALLFLPLAASDPSRREALLAVLGAALAGVLLAPAAARVAARLPARREPTAKTRRQGRSPLERLLAGGEAFARGLATAGSAMRFAGASAATLGYWASGVAGVALWFRAFNLVLPWHAAPLVIVATALGVALPAAPGFLGTYHIAVVGALRLLEVPLDQAVAVAVVGHFVATCPFGLVSLPFLVGETRAAVRTEGVEGAALG